MPEDEATWADLQIMFATDKGNVRRNMLSDFTNIRANGKIAMKLDEDESLIGVNTCSKQCDILLTASDGKCVRFRSTDVRVFASRNSTGVRGIKLAPNAKLISMATIKNTTFTSEERDEYVRLSRMKRAGESIEVELETSLLSQETFNAMAEQEQFILSITVKGFGKRTSAYEYRQSNRATQGIAGMDITAKTGEILVTFPVEEDDQLMMVTDGGKLIRSYINEIRIASRRTQGVRLFRIDDNERVVSADCLADAKEEDLGEDGQSQENEREEGSAGIDGSPAPEASGESISEDHDQ